MLFLLSGAAASGKKTVARQLITRVANVAAHHENEIPATTGEVRMANMEWWVDTAIGPRPRSIQTSSAPTSITRPAGGVRAATSSP